jgi:alkylation response protein AidB-like acyl-CoA dehydrogenase
MELELSQDQTLFQSSLDTLLAKYRQSPRDHAEYVQYSGELQRELGEAGFLNICLQDGFGTLDAALMTESIARLPCSVEVAASALMRHALRRELDGPVALCEDVHRPTRYLSCARYAFILTAEGVRFAELRPQDVRPLASVLAYPLGTLNEMPARSELLSAEVSALVHMLWRIAIAAEAAGLMRGALDLTVNHVKERKQFDRPLGAFQAIRHRLSGDEQIVSASFLLAMRAACSLRPEDAATAALYVQQHMRTVVYDCHQFTGAMGLTLEHPLHLWTYRLKLLQGELGGFPTQAAALADIVWKSAKRKSRWSKPS